MGCGDIRQPDDDTGNEIPLTEATERGHLAVFLHGHKLIGGYALTRIGPPGGRERWLLVKEADGYAYRTRDPVRSNPGIADAGPRQRRTDPSTGWSACC